MTTPTPLAETIARLESLRAAAFEPCEYKRPQSAYMFALYFKEAVYKAWPILLACARRCEAIESVPMSPMLAHLRAGLDDGTDGEPIERYELSADTYRHLVDAASERDALAKRVVQLESVGRIVGDAFGEESEEHMETDQARIRAEAESTRLRAENERLAAEVDAWKDASGLLAGGEHGDPDGVTPAASRRYWEKVEADLTAAQEENARLLIATEEARALVGRVDALVGEAAEANDLRKRLKVAQDRVRELEAMILEGVTFAESATKMGPIADPTQGVVTVGKHFVSTSELDVLELAVAREEEVLEVGDDGMGVVPREFFERCLRARKKTEKPSCIPSDCQHFIKLPSGLWAWVEESTSTVFIDAGDGFRWSICEDDTDFDEWAAHRTVRRKPELPDFLAARALGVRVLRWKA